jgi:hypothetical protein
VRLLFTLAARCLPWIGILLSLPLFIHQCKVVTKVEYIVMRSRQQLCAVLITDFNTLLCTE